MVLKHYLFGMINEYKNYKINYLFEMLNKHKKYK